MTDHAADLGDRPRGRAAGAETDVHAVLDQVLGRADATTSAAGVEDAVRAGLDPVRRGDDLDVVFDLVLAHLDARRVEFLACLFDGVGLALGPHLDVVVVVGEFFRHG